MPDGAQPIGGYRVGVSLATVSGEPTRDRYLQLIASSDALIFVVDSQRSRLQANLDCIAVVRGVLAELSRPDLMLSVQLNKRDLPDIVEADELARLLEVRLPHFPMGVASLGVGVFEAMTVPLVNLFRAERAIRSR